MSSMCIFTSCKELWRAPFGLAVASAVLLTKILSSFKPSIKFWIVFVALRKA